MRFVVGKLVFRKANDELGLLEGALIAEPPRLILEDLGTSYRYRYAAHDFDDHEMSDDEASLFRPDVRS